MTLHARQEIQTARPSAVRTRLPAEVSGSVWPHGNLITAAAFLTEDRTLAMTPPCYGCILYPDCDSDGHTAFGSESPGIAQYSGWPFALSFRATSLW